MLLRKYSLDYLEEMEEMTYELFIILEKHVRVDDNERVIKYTGIKGKDLEDFKEIKQEVKKFHEARYRQSFTHIDKIDSSSHECKDSEEARQRTKLRRELLTQMDDLRQELKRRGKQADFALQKETIKIRTKTLNVQKWGVLVAAVSLLIALSVAGLGYFNSVVVNERLDDLNQRIERVEDAEK